MESNTAAHRLPAAILFPAGLLLVVLAGGLIGLVMAAVGSFFYLAFVFPVLVGLAGGALFQDLARVTKVRRSGQVVLLSFLMTAAMYGTYHYGRYVALQVSTSLELFSSVESALDGENLAAARTFMSYALEDETGHSGFAGYMLYRARTGVSLGRFYSQDRLRLGPAFTWLYWALEFGMTLWVITRMAGKQSDAPLCEACGGCYGSEIHIGGTAPANEPLMLDLIGRNDVVGLGKLIGKNTGLPSLEVYLQRCEACGKSTSLITVRRAALGAKGAVLFFDLSKVALQPPHSRLFLSQLGIEID